MTKVEALQQGMVELAKVESWRPVTVQVGGGPLWEEGAELASAGESALAESRSRPGRLSLDMATSPG